MAGYIIRRLGTAVIVVFGLSVGVFWMLHIIFPSPAIDVLGPKANIAAIAAWNKQNGFDSPWIVQYLKYSWGLLHGNLGFSYKLDQSVTSLFATRWQGSAYLSGVSVVLAIIIALPLGVYQAVKRNTIGDYTATTVSFVLYAMPIFFLGLILIQVFALDLHWFGYGIGRTLNFWQALTDVRDLTLPVATLTLITVANFSRYMRSSSMDVLAQDYVKVARAKGLPERLVLFRHLVRNASLPMLTLVGLFIPALLAGNLVVEDVFNYQGLGLLFYNSLGTADYSVLLAYTLIGALLTVIGNLIADVALTVADPRIRLA
ncbi:MAG TPA: ABC transporter permease [Streptosporangiaceae bacterium]|nr:ABC transporter permease [Streptosporangiaceae bacterium]